MQVDAGIFQCIGSNPAGNIQASAVLTIIGMFLTNFLIIFIRLLFVFKNL